MSEHFVQPPYWEWYIIGYFFLAGLAGGSYVLATILRLYGAPGDAPIARLGYLVSLPLTVVCPIFLTLDLGQPTRFWHMMINTTPGAGGLNFKYWSPMSLGVWVLLAFGVFSLVSFVEALGAGRRTTGWPASAGVRLFTIVGSVLALLLASYTGVLLSVSNQPVWSDGWLLGALFLASGLSGSAALLSWFSRMGPGGHGTEARLGAADRSFAILELVVLVLFFILLAQAGTLGRTLTGPWLVLWVLVVASLIPPLLRMDLGYRVRAATASGAAATAAASSAGTLTALAVLLGVLLMRIVVILSAQL